MKKNPKSVFRLETRSRRAIRNPKSEIDIDYVAKLANLPLTSKEKLTFSRQLQDILGYFSKLGEVDTQKVEPIGHITGLTDIVRDDQTAPSITQEEALKNAPRTHKGFFEVEAIFEEQN
ncbi:MAG: Aspartyl/glutamyl-tRNA(Asn/Gln) amidotransferase subunit C [Candidatus Curtissbacteria bacterium GW2011_GWA2_41_24]|uniref:Aspartyl/glutamyl-tRNA(Asn/Gln) amidotransferase subunit C n=1 Tax=Candidatus Curtissbacteria bacterium GW2011_GWA2_41_24 TaxID=1618411 RepID=A0A0G0VTB3_9BACT|nr:MAG: Aspartyl/glutamyl-tRNA(Asn/Gln) amidotransferase subunit C [Candidatus Curtissbacteria bacterium GW2011_GWA2_41_24]